MRKRPLFLRWLAGTLSLILFLSNSVFADAPRAVVHIQDIHLNREAQADIDKTIAALLKNNDVDLIALEGAFGPIDLTPFQKYPHREIVKTVADWMLERKEIAGPVHAALLDSNAAPAIAGVDDFRAYHANIDAYRQAAPLVEASRARLKRQRIELRKEKTKTFNRALKKFDDAVESLHAGRPALAAFLNALPPETIGYGRFMKTPAEKRLVERSHQLRLMDKMLNFSLTRNEWLEFKRCRATAREADIEKPFVDFYTEAENRDRAMAENFLAAKPGRLSILVTGGFHAAAIDRRLADAGFTVTPFVPKISSASPNAGASYLNAFAQRKNFLSPEPWTPARARTFAVVTMALTAILGKSREAFPALKTVALGGKPGFVIVFGAFRNAFALIASPARLSLAWIGFNNGKISEQVASASPKMIPGAFLYNAVLLIAEIFGVRELHKRNDLKLLMVLGWVPLEAVGLFGGLDYFSSFTARAAMLTTFFLVDFLVGASGNADWRTMYFYRYCALASRAFLIGCYLTLFSIFLETGSGDAISAVIGAHIAVDAFIMWLPSLVRLAGLQRLETHDDVSDAIILQGSMRRAEKMVLHGDGYQPKDDKEDEVPPITLEQLNHEISLLSSQPLPTKTQSKQLKKYKKISRAIERQITTYEWKKKLAGNKKMVADQITALEAQFLTAEKLQKLKDLENMKTTYLRAKNNFDRVMRTVETLYSKEIAAEILRVITVVGAFTGTRLLVHNSFSNRYWWGLIRNSRGRPLALVPMDGFAALRSETDFNMAALGMLESLGWRSNWKSITQAGPHAPEKEIHIKIEEYVESGARKARRFITPWQRIKHWATSYRDKARLLRRRIKLALEFRSLKKEIKLIETEIKRILTSERERYVDARTGVVNRTKTKIQFSDMREDIRELQERLKDFTYRAMAFKNYQLARRLIRAGEYLCVIDSGLLPVMRYIVMLHVLVRTQRYREFERELEFLHKSEISLYLPGFFPFLYRPFIRKVRLDPGEVGMFLHNKSKLWVWLKTTLTRQAQLVQDDGIREEIIALRERSLRTLDQIEFAFEASQETEALDHVSRALKKVLAFLAPRDLPTKTDLILLLGGEDFRVFDKAAQLFKEGRAPKILVSGGRGSSTDVLLKKARLNAIVTAEEEPTISEAEIMRRYLVKIGVPETAIIVEDKAKNTFENLSYSLPLIAALPGNGSPMEIIALKTPRRQRRVTATAKKLFPAAIRVHSHAAYIPPVFPLSENQRYAMINEVLGEIGKLEDGYVVKKNIAPTPIPADVAAAVETLRASIEPVKIFMTEPNVDEALLANVFKDFAGRAVRVNGLDENPDIVAVGPTPLQPGAVEILKAHGIQAVICAHPAGMLPQEVEKAASQGITVINMAGDTDRAFYYVVAKILGQTPPVGDYKPNFANKAALKVRGQTGDESAFSPEMRLAERAKERLYLAKEERREVINQLLFQTQAPLDAEGIHGKQALHLIRTVLENKTPGMSGTHFAFALKLCLADLANRPIEERLDYLEYIDLLYPLIEEETVETSEVDHFPQSANIHDRVLTTLVIDPDLRKNLTRLVHTALINRKEGNPLLIVVLNNDSASKVNEIVAGWPLVRVALIPQPRLQLKEIENSAKNLAYTSVNLVAPKSMRIDVDGLAEGSPFLKAHITLFNQSLRYSILPIDFFIDANHIARILGGEA